MVLYKYVYYNFFDPGTQFPGNEKIMLCNTKKVIIIIFFIPQVVKIPGVKNYKS